MPNEERNNEIAKLYASGQFSMQELGELYQLDKSTISRAVATVPETDAQRLFITAMENAGKQLSVEASGESVGDAVARLLTNYLGRNDDETEETTEQ